MLCYCHLRYVTLSCRYAASYIAAVEERFCVLESLPKQSRCCVWIRHVRLNCTHIYGNSSIASAKVWWRANATIPSVDTRVWTPSIAYRTTTNLFAMRGGRKFSLRFTLHRHTTLLDFCRFRSGSRSRLQYPAIVSTTAP